MDRHQANMERRRNRRIALGCEARLIVQGLATPVDAICTEVAVGGLTLHAAYVPRSGERVEVLVAAPRGGLALPALRVWATVRRCQRGEAGNYEIGLEIIAVLD
ncbi:MAG: PilZ domain-containing protein [Zoogloeaceae bacterium]|nr:PilZ domain-containing protein [Rhodocyclaceae bacterium]MCP5240065.1 PilZ domain-containing protein [Zoogloeaceae bacterium]MCP5253706.1 PilZ domain-containing protein [Zoogloeaceae bacterium]MCW5614724.1 PilZ domain-containing protein [Rhodocyclaceae bacterium]